VCPVRYELGSYIPEAVILQNCIRRVPLQCTSDYQSCGISRALVHLPQRNNTRLGSRRGFCSHETKTKPKWRHTICLSESVKVLLMLQISRPQTHSTISGTMAAIADAIQFFCLLSLCYYVSAPSTDTCSGSRD
jgi:hypothetical protein